MLAAARRLETEMFSTSVPKEIPVNHSRPLSTTIIERTPEKSLSRKESYSSSDQQEAPKIKKDEMVISRVREDEHRDEPKIVSLL